MVNYDFPVGVSGIESYVHRIGRTARGNNSGVSYTFFTPSDSARARDLIELLKRCQQVTPLPSPLAYGAANTPSLCCPPHCLMLTDTLSILSNTPTQHRWYLPS